MDALALLCNLYGDGPATLKRLRSAGLSTVESLEEVEAPGLADTLETTEAAARRFLREARLLGERMVEGGFEEEAQPPIATHGAGPVPILELQEERVFAEPAAPEPRSDDAWAATGVLLSAGSPAGVDQADEPGEPDALPGDDAEDELDIDIEDANEVFDLELGSHGASYHFFVLRRCMRKAIEAELRTITMPMRDRATPYGRASGTSVTWVDTE